MAVHFEDLAILSQSLKTVEKHIAKRDVSDRISLRNRLKELVELGSDESLGELAYAFYSVYSNISLIRLGCSIDVSNDPIRRLTPEQMYAAYKLLNGRERQAFNNMQDE